MELDIREMSFQTVLDQILKPAGVKVGGFPEDMFLDLADDEKEKWACNICYLIVNDCRQCDNKHLFCNTCVFAWSMTYGENSQKCPMCRNEQKEYAENKDVNKSLQDKKVLCPEEACTFKAPLKIFLMHTHGKQKFSNSHVDLESLRPSRPSGARVIMLPTLTLGEPRTPRGLVIRSQLQQGRMMINQMMLLLHLEMQLRQQAFTTLQQAQDSDARVQRLDEVMALNEQLNEVGTILSGLINTPLHAISGGNRSSNTNIAGSNNAEPSPLSAALARQLEADPLPSQRVAQASLPSPLSVSRDSDSDNEESSADEDDDSSLSSTATLPNSVIRSPNTFAAQGSSHTSSSNVAQIPRLGSTLREGQSMIEAARRRRTATLAALSASNTDQQEHPSDSEPHLSSRQSQTSLLSRRQDQNILLPSGSGENISAASSVQRLNFDSDMSSSLDRGVSPRLSLQLPAIRGSGSLSSVDREVQRTPSRSSSESSYETVRSSVMPPGSATLNDIMRDMREEISPFRRTTTTTTRENGVTISVTGSGPLQRREQNSSSTRSQATPTQTQASRPPSRPPSATPQQVESSPSVNRISPLNRPVSDDATRRSEGAGSILPPSLYRRRQNTQTNFNQDTSRASSGTNPNQRQLLSSRIPGHTRNPVTRTVRGGVQNGTGRTRVDLSMPTSSVSRPTLSSSRNTVAPSSSSTNPSVRPRVPGERVAMRRTPKLGESTSQPSNSTQQPRTQRTLSRSLSQNQQPSGSGSVQSRRRSDARTQNLTRKDAG